jgi:hypothetical protein
MVQCKEGISKRGFQRGNFSLGRIYSKLGPIEKLAFNE